MADLGYVRHVGGCQDPGKEVLDFTLCAEANLDVEKSALSVNCGVLEHKVADG